MAEDISAQEDVAAHGCPLGSDCVGEAQLCKPPFHFLVPRKARRQHCWVWGHRSSLRVEGWEVLSLALGCPRGCPGWGGSASPGAPQSSTLQRRSAVVEYSGGWWTQVSARPLGVEDLGVDAAATWSRLKTCMGEWES